MRKLKIETNDPQLHRSNEQFLKIRSFGLMKTYVIGSVILPNLNKMPVCKTCKFHHYSYSQLVVMISCDKDL